MRLLLLLVGVACAARPEVTAAQLRVGDAEAAERTLRVLEKTPGVDAGVLGVLRARLALLKGSPESALAAVGGLRKDPDLGLVALRLYLRAEVLRGDASAIVRAAEALLGAPNLPRPMRYEAELQRGRHHPEAAEGVRVLEILAKDKAAGPYRSPALEALAARSVTRRRAATRRLVVDFGATAEGRKAATKRALGRLSRKDRDARAQRLYTQRAYDLAEPELLSVAGDPKQPGKVRQRAWLRAAVIRMRLREGYDKALARLKRARKGPNRKLANEGWFRSGLVLGNLKRWDAAVKAMKRYLKRARRGRFRASAAYQVGRLQHQAGRYDKAIVEQKRFLKKRRRDHAKYQWFLGWSHFRKGDCAGARSVWAPILDDENTLVGPKVLYWTARCLQKQGEAKGMKAALDTLHARAPLSYYGLLGASLQGRALPTAPRLSLAPAPNLRAWEPKLAPDLRAELRGLRRLIEAGYPELARDRAPSRSTLESALGSSGAEAMRDTLERALEYYGRRWKRAPETRLPWREGVAKREAEVIAAAYPPAYLDLARAAGRPHSVSPWWLLPHMLQESRFKERARSHAGALGPMQVLPRTGKRIAARLRFPAGDFVQAELFTPGVALRHAAWYLDALRAEFGGNVLLAMAAYNGGPRRVAEHLRLHPDLPFDVLIEEIGAHETRNYARKIADHVVRYATLYASPPERAALLESLRPPATLPEARGELTF